jgi:hypothetical protein
MLPKGPGDAMDWKLGTPLNTEQTAHALMWHGRVEDFGYAGPLPQRDNEWFERFWGDGKSNSRRLRTFGHVTKNRANAHFLCTRSGLGWHTDPGSTRYALQIQLINHGFVVHGLEDDIAAMPLFTPGLVTLLDAWSPHEVARDPRLPQIGLNKLLVGADFKEVPDINREIRPLLDLIPALPL